MLFWMKTRVGKNYVLDGVQIPQGEGAVLGFVLPIDNAL